jgi:hypothetical protein
VTFLHLVLFSRSVEAAAYDDSTKCLTDTPAVPL